MHAPPPPEITTTPTALFPSTTTSPTLLRIGTTLLLGGLVAEYGVTTLHPAHQNPNDHHAVFAEYAASDNWIAVHLGQFATGMIVIAGIITLLRALRPPTGPSLLTRIAEAAAILTASAIAVLQGIDGFTLKHAVDSLASAPPGMHDAAFHDAEIVRWNRMGRGRLLPHHPGPHHCPDRCRNHPLTHSPPLVRSSRVAGRSGLHRRRRGGRHRRFHRECDQPGRLGIAHPVRHHRDRRGLVAPQHPPGRRGRRSWTLTEWGSGTRIADGTAEDRPGGTPCAQRDDHRRSGQRRRWRAGQSRTAPRCTC